MVQNCVCTQRQYSSCRILNTVICCIIMHFKTGHIFADLLILHISIIVFDIDRKLGFFPEFYPPLIFYPPLEPIVAIVGNIVIGRPGRQRVSLVVWWTLVDLLRRGRNPTLYRGISPSQVIHKTQTVGE